LECSRHPSDRRPKGTTPSVFGKLWLKRSVATIPVFVSVECIAAVLYRLNDVVASGETLNQLLVVGVQ
jgi:hypothetical protein